MSPMTVMALVEVVVSCQYILLWVFKLLRAYVEFRVPRGLSGVSGDDDELQSGFGLCCQLANDQPPRFRSFARIGDK